MPHPLRAFVALTLVAACAWAQDSANLVLTSQPEGAAIFLNGEDSRLSTPTTIRVPVGDVRIAFLKRDYLVSVHHGTVGPEETLKIQAELLEDLEIPYRAQLSGIPDFVEGRREGLEFFSSVVELSTSYYVEETESAELVKEALRALVEGLEGIRQRETLLHRSLTPEDIADYYRAEADLSGYDPLELSVRDWDDGAEQWTLRTSVATISRIFESDADQARALENFGDFYAFIEEDYDVADRIPDDGLINLAVQGLISKLGDEHTRMIYPVAYDDMKSKHKGEFGGLGISIQVKDGALTVITPIDGTPAFRQGILAGDVITHIEGTPTAELSLQESVSRMRGEPGTDVTITIARPGAFDAQDFTISRAVIPLRFSRKLLIEEDIGYVRLTSFNSRRIASDLAADIKELQEQGARSLILDLRNNPGGLLTQAHEVVDLFVGAGLTVSVKGRIKQEELLAEDTGDEFDLPLVVLINAGSASASEIVAGALQDYDRATIVGEQSFGKGSVQMVLPIDPFDTAMALTIAKYYLPSGRTIHKHGVTPDTMVELSLEERREVARVSLYDQTWQPSDRQLEEAIRLLRTQP